MEKEQKEYLSNEKMNQAQKKNTIQQVEIPIDRIWTVGSGSSGVLLSGHLEDITVFQQQQFKHYFMQDLDKKDSGLEQKENIDEIINIQYDGMMAVGVTQKGQVFRWGECALVEGEKKKKDIITNPQMISLPIRVTNLECGWHHSIFFDKENPESIFGFGSNSFGELGLGVSKKQFISQPTPIPIQPQFFKSDSNQKLIKKIHCGFRQSYIFLENGSVLVTGQNKSFELGISREKVKISYEFVANDNEQLLEKAKKLKMIKTGYKFACILVEGGQLFAWGDNKYQQILNDGNVTIVENLQLVEENVETFCMGWNHYMALVKKEGGNEQNNQILVLQGRNDMGQLGNGKLNEQSEENKQQSNICNKNVIDFCNLYLENGEVIKDLSCGSECNYILSSSGRVFAWGWNEHGNLGNNSLENVYTPLEVPINKQVIEQQKENCQKQQRKYQPNQIYAQGAICILIQHKDN